MKFCCVPPALRQVSVAVLRCLPLAQKRNNVGEAELFRMTKWKSFIETLPPPAPVPCEEVPSWVAPQLNDSISHSSLWDLSFDSPLTSVIFRNMSTAIASTPQVFSFGSVRLAIPAELTLITTSLDHGDVTPKDNFSAGRPPEAGAAGAITSRRPAGAGRAHGGGGAAARPGRRGGPRM